MNSSDYEDASPNINEDFKNYISTPNKYNYNRNQINYTKKTSKPTILFFR